METNDFYSTLLNDAWTVYMTFSGILISIITLLYSVILGKRSELEVYAEQTKLGHSVAKTEHSHPLGMVVSTHFRCGKGVKRGLKNGALPFNID